jgi:predicted short-subunit dehydrogenase-like oxidoreductase (DUF2520 family)
MKRLRRNSPASAAPLVAIVGAGRVGRALGRLLHQKKWRIGSVISRSLRSAREARRQIGGGEPHAAFSPAILAADVIIISTPDRAIAQTAAALARIEPSTSGPHSLHPQKGIASAPWRGKIVLHTSGALSSDVLAPLARRGASVGSLHPLQTFSGRAIPLLAGSICVIEGNATALRMARRICRALGCIPVKIPPQNKAAYHAGAALAAGHILAVMEAAVRMLAKAGFSRRRAIAALLPLTRQTLANYERAGVGARAAPQAASHVAPHPAWTGPLARADFAVIKRHLEALRRFPPEYREAYKALSRLAVTVLANGNPSKRQNLEQIFS